MEEIVSEICIVGVDVGETLGGGAGVNGTTLLGNGVTASTSLLSPERMVSGPFSSVDNNKFSSLTLELLVLSGRTVVIRTTTMTAMAIMDRRRNTRALFVWKKGKQDDPPPPPHKHTHAQNDHINYIGEKL